MILIQITQETTCHESEDKKNDLPVDHFMAANSPREILLFRLIYKIPGTAFNDRKNSKNLIVSFYKSFGRCHYASTHVNSSSSTGAVANGVNFNKVSPNC